MEWSEYKNSFENDLLKKNKKCIYVIGFLNCVLRQKHKMKTDVCIQEQAKKYLLYKYYDQCDV